jgi:hypothetical protein
MQLSGTTNIRVQQKPKCFSAFHDSVHAATLDSPLQRNCVLLRNYSVIIAECPANYRVAQTEGSVLLLSSLAAHFRISIAIDNCLTNYK